MRYLFIIILTLTLCQCAIAQLDYDAISAKDIHILKTDSVLNRKILISTHDLKNAKQAEQIFGSNYTLAKYYSELFGENFTRINYQDGLILVFSDDYKDLFTFRIESDKYTMVISNGKQIRNGMQGMELLALFPKSYSKRVTQTDPGTSKGKTSFKVFFSIKTGNKEIFADAWITFIMSDKDGSLEQFYSFVPG
jgi:hypothetical protein